MRALWTLDSALGAAAFSGREPMIRRIKLAWWREALERLDSAPPPAEPHLQAAAAELLPCGIRGVELAELADAWAEIEEADGAGRGAILFALSARLLGGEADEKVRSAGEGWARVDLARRRGESSAEWLVPSGVWPRRLRPLGMLAVLARADARRGFGRPGSPRRMARMLGHWLTGR